VLVQRRNSPASRLLSRSYREELVRKGMKGKVTCGSCHPFRFDGPDSCSNQTPQKRSMKLACSGEGYFHILNVIESTLKR
jgi:hypothetical protein